MTVTPATTDEPLRLRQCDARRLDAEDRDDTLRIVKTPAFTTATACSSALTGVGATIAAGSQKCSGITAALPMPKT